MGAVTGRPGTEEDVIAGGPRVDATLRGWEPTRPGLIADLELEHYFEASAA